MKAEKSALFLLFAGLSTSVIWGVSFLSIKVSVVALPPMTLAFVRFMLACSVLAIIARLNGESLGLRLAEVPSLAASGLIGITLYFFGENNGVNLLSVSESSLIIGTIPIFIIICDRIIYKNKFKIRIYIGVLLSFAGVALIVSQSRGGKSSLLGFLFMALAAFSWIVYNFMIKNISRKITKIKMTFWQCFFGALGCIPFALTETSGWQLPDVTIWLHVVYLGVFCSAIGYWLYNIAVAGLGPGKTSVFINLIPVVAVTTGFIFLGERLELLQFFGGGVAVVGVYLATFPGSTRRGLRSNKKSKVY